MVALSRLLALALALCPLTAQAAITFTSLGSWTCASGATCNNTLSVAPTAGDVLFLTSMAIDGIPGNANTWRASSGNCGGTQTWNVQQFSLTDVGTSTNSVSMDVSNLVTAPSTTCNVNATGDTLTGSVRVIAVRGLLTTNIAGKSYADGTQGNNAWATQSAPAATASKTPANSGESLFCVFGATISTVAASFSGGALTWTSYLNDTVLGSNDDGSAGPYNSVAAVTCSYSFTGTMLTGGFFILLIPGSSGTGGSGIYPPGYYGG